MEKVILKDLQLHKGNYKEGGCGYYLSAEYIKETNDGIYSINIPEMKLDINHHGFIYKVEPFDRLMFYPNATVDIGFGDLKLPYHNHIIETKIEDKVHKMTVEEIEKGLGYKVEIVSEK